MCAVGVVEDEDGAQAATCIVVGMVIAAVVAGVGVVVGETPVHQSKD